MVGGWVEKRDADGNLIHRIREDNCKIYYKKRQDRFERGYCEVWVDEFDIMFEIIDKHVTCFRIGTRLVPKLMKLAEFDTGEILVDQTLLAQELGVQRQQLNMTLKEFLDLGLLELVGKKAKHNIYRFPEEIIWKGRSEKRFKLIHGEADKKFNQFLKSSSIEPPIKNLTIDASGERVGESGSSTQSSKQPQPRKVRTRCGAVAAQAQQDHERSNFR